jgi:hypothetical protein
MLVLFPKPEVRDIERLSNKTAARLLQLSLRRPDLVGRRRKVRRAFRIGYGDTP